MTDNRLSCLFYAVENIKNSCTLLPSNLLPITQSVKFLAPDSKPYLGLAEKVGEWGQTHQTRRHTRRGDGKTRRPFRPSIVKKFSGISAENVSILRQNAANN
jgi:hypothetical protein